MSIRETIVAIFRETSQVPSIAVIAEYIDQPVAVIEERLRTEKPLATFESMTPEQAQSLVDYFGKGVIFLSSLDQIMEALQNSKERITLTERSLPDRSEQ